MLSNSRVFCALSTVAVVTASDNHVSLYEKPQSICLRSCGHFGNHVSTHGSTSLN